MAVGKSSRITSYLIFVSIQSIEMSGGLPSGSPSAMMVCVLRDRKQITLATAIFLSVVVAFCTVV